MVNLTSWLIFPPSPNSNQGDPGAPAADEENGRKFCIGRPFWINVNSVSEKNHMAKARSLIGLMPILSVHWLSISWSTFYLKLLRDIPDKPPTWRDVISHPRTFEFFYFFFFTEAINQSDLFDYFSALTKRNWWYLLFRREETTL